MNTPPESFIHYLWVKKLIPSFGLFTENDEKIEILNYGELNKVSGPDIFNAKLKIGDTIWVGNVEIHVHSSDWYKHKHDVDSAYNNVILHVVFNDDKPVLLQNKQIETLVLPKEFCKFHFKKFKNFLKQKSGALPCSSFLNEIPSVYIENWKTKLLSDRIQRKLEIGGHANDIINYTWRIVMINFGMKYNNNPMKVIALATDFREFESKQKHEIDNYFLGLSNLGFPISMNEFNNMQTKINVPLNLKVSPEWKFGGIRPANQPIIKLMQFSSFLSLTQGKLLEWILAADFKQIDSALEKVQIHSYWETHSSFYKKIKPRSLSLGESFKTHLKINAFLPLFLHLNKKLRNKDVAEEVFEFYDLLPKESNRIVNSMEEYGFQNKNSFDSQSLLQLNNYYCQSKKCLNCAIGNKIID
jgi:hypothetical protein